MSEEHQVLTAVYRRLLHLFSAHFRQEFEEEMVAVFKEQLDAAADGRLALFTLLLHELGGLIAEGVRQWLYARQAQALLLAQAGDKLMILVEHSWPWRKTLFLIACLLPLLPVAVFLAGFSAMRASENRLAVNRLVLADFDSDGRLDALIILNRHYRHHPHNRILVNEGDGRFAAGDLWPEGGFAQAVATGDLDSDGHIDVVAANFYLGGLARYLNDGSGAFIPFGVVPDSHGGIGSIQDAALGDLNGDGRPDAFVAGCCPGGEVWLNHGDGLLSSSRQRLGQIPGHAVALADLNGDSSLDAFLVSGPNGPHTVWSNDGQGNFSDSGQQLGHAGGFVVALGDVNADGFPDAVVGNEGPDEVWLNGGQGNFGLGQRFGRGFTGSLFLADLDSDSDLDIIVSGSTSSRVWLNDGPARFREGQRIRYGRYEAIAVGDVTGDGIMDIFVAGVESYKVWQGVGDGRFTADGRFSYR